MEETVQLVRLLVGLVGLGYFGIEDIRRRELATVPILLACGIGAALSLFGGMWRDFSVLWQFFPGALCLLFAKVSRESIGYGDGLVLLCLGCYLPLAQLLETCMMALSLAGIVALFLILVLHRGRGCTLPFVPFLLAGYVLTLTGAGV